MADVIQIARGAPPWRPSGDAKLVQTFLRYNVPLMGVIEQHNVQYVFTCAAGRGEPMSLWLYAVLPDGAGDYLAGLDREELENAISEMLQRGHAALAMALDDAGVIASTVVENVSELALQHAVDSMLESLQQGFRAAQSELSTA